MELGKARGRETERSTRSGAIQVLFWQLSPPAAVKKAGNRRPYHPLPESGSAKGCAITSVTVHWAFLQARGRDLEAGGRCTV